MSKKSQLGQFFTTTNPFTLKVFKEWLHQIPDYKNLNTIEPFAGANNLVKMLSSENLKWTSYDIEPKNPLVKKKDTLKNFPKGFEICITNPPYLGKSSSTRSNMNFPETVHDDLYKLALEKCLENCDYVAAIIPESFITSNLFHNRLVSVISLNFSMFEDTDHPVCLALFNKEETKDFDIYRGDTLLGSYNELKSLEPKPLNKYKVKFNDPKGILGLRAVDNTKTASIEFIEGKLIDSSDIKVSSRAITRISFDKEVQTYIKKIGTKKFIDLLNNNLKSYREKTKDVFMTSFKGLRKDGFYRRRLDYILAKKIILSTVDEIISSS